MAWLKLLTFNCIDCSWKVHYQDPLHILQDQHTRSLASQSLHNGFCGCQALQKSCEDMSLEDALVKEEMVCAFLEQWMKEKQLLTPLLRSSGKLWIEKRRVCGGSDSQCQYNCTEEWVRGHFFRACHLSGKWGQRANVSRTGAKESDKGKLSKACCLRGKWGQGAS